MLSFSLKSPSVAFLLSCRAFISRCQHHNDSNDDLCAVYLTCTISPTAYLPDVVVRSTAMTRAGRDWRLQNILNWPRSSSSNISCRDAAASAMHRWVTRVPNQITFRTVSYPRASHQRECLLVWGALQTKGHECTTRNRGQYLCVSWNQ